MAKNNTELQALAQPQSRNEKFLNHIVGRAVDLNLLPDPQSRIEEYLEYLCYNGGIGGGGGANPFVGLTDAVINNNIITFQKSDGTTVQVDLNELNTRINNIVPTQGNINLELRQVGDSIRLQVEGQDAGVIDLAGFVKSVNNIAPVVGANGNITLNAEHMNYDDANTQLGANTVQEAIDILKDNMDLIDTADIHIVANEAELNNLLAQGVLKKSDIIYIIDSTGVVDYDNVNVNNGTNPVAMIYDDGVVGNHLRVFSKVVPTINLNASNVAFNSNTVDGVTANNVQEAIKQVNDTARNSYNDSTYDPATGILTLIKENGTRDEHNFSTGLIKNVSYDVQTQMLNIETVDGQTLNADLSDLASKTLDNIFTGKNTFKDINLGLPIQVNANQSIQNGGWSNANLEVKTGHRGLTSHSQNSNGYVRNLVVRVGDINLGEKVNVNVWEVKKGQDRSGDIPIQLYSNLELTTVEHTGYFGGGVAVKIPINKKYTDETYFIYQVVGAARIFRVSGATANDDYIFLMPDVDVTQNNIATSPKDSVGAHILELGDVNVGDLLSGISSGAVTSVNNIKPVDGNVTVNAEHIEYNNQTSQLIATDVQSAIDELNDKFIEDVAYNETQNRTIFKTKGGQQEVVVEGLVTRWKHLENVTQSNNFNIFNPTTFIEGRYYGVNGVVVSDLNWGHFNIPCSAGETFTVFKKRYDSRNFGLLDSNVEWFQNLAQVSTTDGVWQKYLINIPQNQRVAYLSIPVYKVDNDYKNGVMVFEGNVTAPTEYIPFTNNREISIDGEKVNISFDALTTTLSTNSIVDAVKELDMKVTNVGTGIVTSVNGIQPVNGEVTVNAEHIGYNGNTSNIIATNVQEAIDKLKEDVVLIDGAEIYIKANKAELDDFLNNPNTLKHGDLIYIINSTGVVDYTGQPANGGNPVAMIYDNTLTTGNKLRVFSKFSSNVNVSANNVSYDDVQTNLQANNVQGAIKALNDKKIDVTKIGNTNGKIPQIGTGNKLEVSIIPNIPISNVTNLRTELDSKVVTVNQQTQQGGNVTLDGTHINATVGVETLNIQEHLGRINNKVIQAEADAQMARSEVNVLTNHLNTNVINRINGHDTSINSLNGTTNDHSTRIRILERRVPTPKVGELIQTFANGGNSYSQGGIYYIWLGRTNNTVQRGQYPELFNVFGIASTSNAFDLPYIQDQSVQFDYGKTIRRKTYIVAKVSN